MSTITIVKELITPIRAKEILKLNSSNRGIAPRRIDNYARQMSEGLWKEDTCEAIKISLNNVLLDGQHRLEALIKANVSVWFHIAYNLDDSVFSVIDTGKSRNAADCFKIKGKANYSVIPSIIAYYNALKVNSKTHRMSYTNAELISQYESNDMYWDNVVRFTLDRYIAFSKILPTSVIGGFFVLLSEINHAKAVRFMNQLCTGEGVENNAIYLLRKKLMEDKLNATKMPADLKRAYIIKSWNFFTSGKTTTVLKYSSLIEEYPVILNY